MRLLQLTSANAGKTQYFSLLKPFIIPKEGAGMQAPFFVAQARGVMTAKNPCRFVKHMLHHQARNHPKRFEEISIPAGA